jgi:hypothetical protein
LALYWHSALSAVLMRTKRGPEMVCVWVSVIHRRLVTKSRFVIDSRPVTDGSLVTDCRLVIDRRLVTDSCVYRRPDYRRSYYRQSCYRRPYYLLQSCYRLSVSYLLSVSIISIFGIYYLINHLPGAESVVLCSVSLVKTVLINHHHLLLLLFISTVPYCRSVAKSSGVLLYALRFYDRGVKTALTSHFHWHCFLCSIFGRIDGVS